MENSLKIIIDSYLTWRLEGIVENHFPANLWKINGEGMIELNDKRYTTVNVQLINEFKGIFGIESNVICANCVGKWLIKHKGVVGIKFWTEV